MLKLVLLRHGESEWNLENRFTGWTDVDLSDRGIEEAHRASRLLKAEGYSFDMAYTSLLKRAIRTLWIALDELDLMWIPVHRSWRLNERHYGALQGLNKRDTAEKYGLDQVHLWRRGYDVPPPALAATDSRHPRFDNAVAFAGEFSWLAAVETMIHRAGDGLDAADCLIAPPLAEFSYLCLSKRAEMKGSSQV